MGNNKWKINNFHQFLIGDTSNDKTILIKITKITLLTKFSQFSTSVIFALDIAEDFKLSIWDDPILLHFHSPVNKYSIAQHQIILK